MYLHSNISLFKDVIAEVNIRTGIAQSVLEKDYYLTMILKLLREKNDDIVFKGGTSLSKCYHLIDRFSEDIDITFGEHIGEARRKKLKYNVIKPVSDELELPIGNWDSIESDRNYNYYLFSYDSVVEDEVMGITPSVRLETALVSYSFPVEEKYVKSIIGESLTDFAQDMVNEYGLSPFMMKVQDVKRTFIDKIFALCDYYLQGKSKRYSRHLYDIYKIYPSIVINDDFMRLLEQVRNHRATLSICPFAQIDVDIKSIIKEFIDNDFYKRDYENVTENLISDNVTYEQTIDTMEEIAEKLFRRK